MSKLTFEIVNLSTDFHRMAVVNLLNEYMEDEMGRKKSFDPALHTKVLSDLASHENYIGFLLKAGNEYVALANCFLNYSTFQANHLLNIHDYVVSSAQRGNGYGKALLQHIVAYAEHKAYCRISLEVRDDNVKAKSLYNALGFKECEPRMLFWEKDV